MKMFAIQECTQSVNFKYSYIYFMKILICRLVGMAQPYSLRAWQTSCFSDIFAINTPILAMK